MPKSREMSTVREMPEIPGMPPIPTSTNEIVTPKFCHACGAKIMIEGSRFCASCGKELYR